MFINEVCKITGLTKKAIEYYEEKGLIAPEVEQNGYRNFSSDDVEKLKEIAVLRKLGLSISEIRDVLLGNNQKASLAKVKFEKDLELQEYAKKRELLDKLIDGQNVDEIAEQLRELERHQTIKKKLMDAFPGYYGYFLIFHFGRFLDEPILSQEQEDAYNNIVEFLDGVKTAEFPAEVKEYFEMAGSIMDQGFLEGVLESVQEEVLRALENVEDYIEKNKDSLEQYIAYKNSDEYKSSPEYKIQNLLLEFYNTSGYYDVFIPNMRKLSRSYDEYMKKLEQANKEFLKRYPEACNWYKGNE